MPINFRLEFLGSPPCGAAQPRFPWKSRPQGHMGWSAGLGGTERSCLLGIFMSAPQMEESTCGGHEVMFCQDWGCEKTGTMYWKHSSSRDWVTVGRTPKMISSMSHNSSLCISLQDNFTETGKKVDLAHWLNVRTWGLRFMLMAMNRAFISLLNSEWKYLLGLLVPTPFSGPYLTSGPSQPITVI